MSGPRLSSNNGTNQHEQQRWWKDAVANSPTNPDQFTNKVCGEKLEKEEQHSSWRVAATTNANSTVQRNPKSKGCGERNYWWQAVCVTKAGHLDAAVGLPTRSAVQRNPKSWLTKSSDEQISWKDGIVPSPQASVRGYY